ncbi:hypothetical protein ACHQM5_008635 [Ranunculus cassubicifolius]
MQPFSRHTNFFSSLKQVEKRLKSEHSSPIQPQISDQPTQPSSTDQLSAPLYLYASCDQPTSNTQTQDSHAPLEFLSHSSSCIPQTSPPQVVPEIDQNINEEVEHGKDDIQELLELLGLLEIDKEDNSELKKNVNKGCGGDGSFYSKIVGVKGPKNEKERERLDGWIKYYLSGNADDDGGVKEPLRLVHLLIGKAIVANEEEDCGGFGDIEFPSTVQEFLEYDPPRLHD